MSLLRARFSFAISLAVFGCGTSANEPPGVDGASGGVTGSGGMTSLPSGGSGGVLASGGNAGSGGATEPTGPARFEVLGVTTWRFGATAAYSIMHDDTCNDAVDNQFDIAAPELEERGLVGSFGAIAADCVSRSLGSKLAGLTLKGHEVANHSNTHVDLGDLGNSDLSAANADVDTAHTSLAAAVSPARVETFLFPFDSFHDSVISHLASKGYLAVRAGGRGHNAVDFADPLSLNFDVFGPGYSLYSGTGPCASVDSGAGYETASPECRKYVLDKYVDDTIAIGGYGIRELHSVEGEAWEPVPRAEYEAHLDYVKSKVNTGDLWVGTVGDVVRYRFARGSCPLPIGTYSGLAFGVPTGDCAKFHTKLTYRVKPLAGGPAIAVAKQGGASAVVTRVGEEFLVTVDPGGGPVTFE